MNNESLFSLYISWVILSISRININHWNDKFQNLQENIKDVINEVQYNKQRNEFWQFSLYEVNIFSRFRLLSSQTELLQKAWNALSQNFFSEIKMPRTKTHHLIKHIPISNLVMYVLTKTYFTAVISHLKDILYSF